MTTLDIAEIEKVLREADLVALEAYRKGTADAPLLYKADGHVKELNPNQPMVFVASEESEDRFGDLISAAGWQLDGYKKNPVWMFAHDHSIAPIGTVPKIWIDGKQLLNAVKWDEPDEFARFIQGKYQRGIMRAVSVGFRALEFEERSGNGGGRSGILFKKQELLEISAVPVPAHPHALAKALGNRKFSIIVPDVTPILPVKIVIDDVAEQAAIEDAKRVAAVGPVIKDMDAMKQAMAA
ncbi:MAG: HK97 family phage prohead protease, partial [bacterium]|nr:HK97 family phage prohead protease [bacterium]